MLLLFCFPAGATGSPVIYVSGTGNDSNSGLTSLAPVATLSKAIELLDGDGGTIVVVGNVTEQTGLTIPAQSESLYITSSYGGVNYNAKLNFGSAANLSSKNMFFTSGTVIDNITINYNISSSASDKLLTLYSGSSLTIGENVQITRTDENSSIHTTATQVTIRGGVNGVNIANTQINVASGVYKYILAGNSTAGVGTSAITISGTAVVSDFVQNGGVTGAVDHTTLTISGGKVNTVYVDGYNKNMTSSTVNITGGSVGEITDYRGSSATNISSSLTLTISNKAMSQVGEIDLNIDHSALKKLNLKGPNNAGEAYIEFVQADFSDWDQVKISDRAIVYLNALYQAPQSTLTVDTNSKLVLTENTVIPAGLSAMTNVELDYPILFIDPVNGSDTNGGRRPGAPVKTWSKAVTVLNNRGGTVVVYNDVVMVQGSASVTTIQQLLPELTGTLTITGLFNGVDYDSAILLGASDNNSKIMLGARTPTVIKDITIRYNRSASSGTSAEIWSGQSLKIGSNVTVEATGTNNQITLRSGYYDKLAASASLTVLSGSWNYVQGGNSDYNVTVSNLTFGGEAVAQYIQGGGTYNSVGVSNVNLTGGTVMETYYVNGFGSASRSATLGSANITISGGNVAAIYDARNTYSPISGAVTLTYTGEGSYGIALVDLNQIGMISGSKDLVFSNAPKAIINGDFSQWNTVNIRNSSSIYVKWNYVAPIGSLTIETGSRLYVYTGTNTVLPTYAGGGTASFVSTITRTTDKLTESLYMALNIPESHDGTDVDKEQGMAVLGDHLFVFHNDGVSKVYDLQTKSSTPISTFNLGSYNTGVPDSNYANHANTAMFSDYYYVDPVTGVPNDIPLLMVRTGNGSGADSTGYYARLSIENITKTVDAYGAITYSSQVLQTIIYSDYYDGNKTVTHFNAANGTSYVPAAGFGAPMWMVDSANDAIYILSAKYRTTYGSVGNTTTYPGYYTVADNYYVVTKFDMTDWTVGGTVVLTPQHIKDQFRTEFAAFSTQGGTLFDEKIIYTFGFGQIAGYNPGAILVFDLNNEDIELKVDLSRSMFAFEELEGSAVYNGKLLVNTQAGFIYELDINDLDL